jgi:hypothetical protein
MRQEDQELDGEKGCRLQWQRGAWKEECKWIKKGDWELKDDSDVKKYIQTNKQTNIKYLLLVSSGVT